MHPIRALRAALIDQVRELAAAGRSDPEIANTTGLTVEGVRTMRRRANIPPGVPPGGGPVRSDWRERITAAWEDGLTIEGIAAATGYAVRTVRDRLTELRLVAHRGPAPACTGEAHAWSEDRCTVCGLVRREVRSGGRRGMVYG